jgi:hypothetical protein
MKNARRSPSMTAARLGSGLRPSPASILRGTLATCLIDGGFSSSTTAEHSWIDGGRLVYRRTPSDAGQVLAWELNSAEEKNNER